MTTGEGYQIKLTTHEVKGKHKLKAWIAHRGGDGRLTIRAELGYLESRNGILLLPQEVPCSLLLPGY